MSPATARGCGTARLDVVMGALACGYVADCVALQESETKLARQVLTARRQGLLLAHRQLQQLTVRRRRALSTASPPASLISRG